MLLLRILVWLGLLWAGWTLVFAADPDAVISGLGLTTLAITSLMPVISAVTARRAQANIIAGLGSTPQEIVRSGLRDHRLPYCEHRLQALADSIMETAEKHLSYPVLHYFHSAERRVDLRTQAQLLDEAVTLLQHGVAADVQPHPAVLDGLRQRHAIAQLVERATDGSLTAPPPAAPASSVLREAGIPTFDGDTFERSVAGLSEHRRRVAHLAHGSLWSIQGS